MADDVPPGYQPAVTVDSRPGAILITQGTTKIVITGKLLKALNYEIGKAMR